MALVSYSSSSETESDAEPPKPKIQKPSAEKRLILPSAISCMNKMVQTFPVDDPSKHDGRVRSFEHERGNWATLVYIPVDLSVIDEVDTIVTNFCKDIVDLKYSENIHISLTKTVILRHHWIKLFVKSIQEALVASEHFPLDFQTLNVYTNEDRTRTFVGLVAGDIYFEKLHKLLLQMDKVMTEFRLETFYENPSFHASILWCLGDYEKPLKAKLGELNVLLLELSKANPDDFQIRVDEIHCKSGNRSYQFKLK